MRQQSSVRGNIVVDSQEHNHEPAVGNSADEDSVTRVAQIPGINAIPPAGEGSSRSASSRRAGLPPRDDKTRISKRSPAAEVPALKPALNPFELGRTLEGERLGHFQLEKFVGGGGMGAVFRAADTMLGRIVAVKVLSRDQTDDDTLRRFKNEAQSAARLDHPNIARVYYVGEDRDLHYIVFEFIDGANMRDLVAENGPLSISDALHFTLQVAEALEHASHRDVVHRDIKPSNVLVMPDGHVKLVDMGLARLHQVEASAADLTASGVTLGTFDYISPEQARDPRSADVRSDLYSLGCTLFYMLTGRAPFPVGTVLQKLLSHSSEMPPDVRTLRDGIDDSVAAIVNKLLAKQPSQRYQTPNELIAALVMVADHLGLADVGQRGRFLVTPTEPRFSWIVKHLPWAVPVLLLFAMVLMPRWWMPAPQPVTLNEIRRTFLASHEALPTSSSNEHVEPKVEKNPVIPLTPLRDTSEKGNENSSIRPSVPKVEATNNDVPAKALTPTPTPLPSSNNTTSTETSSDPPKTDPETPMPISVLVVDDGSATLPAGTRRVRSLAEAIRLATESKEITTIQLSYNGERQETAMDLPPRGLEIRAGDGFQPVITFRPKDAELSVDRHMLRAVGGQFIWRHVHLRMELPSDPYDNWSLFQIAAGTGLAFTDCTLTIRNVSDSGTILQNQASFIQLLPTQVTETNKGSGDGKDMMMIRSTPSVIEFSNCIARGQAVLVESPEALPFRLLLNQMLFATTERLVELGGAQQQPTLGDTVEIDLRHVTAYVGDGLCFSKIDQNGPYPLELVLTCHNSIVLTGTNTMTGAKAPLLQRRGTVAQPYRYEGPRVRGEGNFYPDTSVILAVDATGNRDDFTDFTFSERHEARKQGWYDDHPEPGLVVWKNPKRSARRVDLHTKNDYLLEESPSNKAFQVAGFTASLLPNLPDAPSPENPVPAAEPSAPPANE